MWGVLFNPVQVCMCTIICLHLSAVFDSWNKKTTTQSRVRFGYSILANVYYGATPGSSEPVTVMNTLKKMVKREVINDNYQPMVPYLDVPSVTPNVKGNLMAQVRPVLN